MSTTEYTRSETKNPRWKEFTFSAKRFLKNPLTIIGLVIILGFAVVAIMAPILAPPWQPDDPYKIPHTGWEMDPALAIEIGKIAVETGLWILYESENGKRTITKQPKKKKSVDEYFKLQGRFSHVTDAQIQEIQKSIDMKWQEFVECQ